MKTLYQITLALLVVTVSGCDDDWNSEYDLVRNKATVENGIRVFSEFPATIGLNIDSKILKTAFSKNISVVDQKRNPDNQVFVNIFFEFVDSAYLKRAKYNWLVLNQDLAPSVSDFRRIDLVICKSRYAVELMKELRRDERLNFAIVYTKFTTDSLKEDSDDTNYLKPKNYDLALHAAGQSPFKGTGAVLETWFNDPTLPQLVVACRDHSDGRAGCKHVNQSYMNKKTPPNLEIYSDELIPRAEFDYLMAHAGIFVVPSEMEGYGHYINEGRKSGAIVITTDAPPMNELVEDGVNGILIPVVSRKLYRRSSGAERFWVEARGIRDAMARVKKMTPEQRVKMGQLARKAYEDDTNFLNERVARLVESLKATGDLTGAADILE